MAANVPRLPGMALQRTRDISKKNEGTKMRAQMYEQRTRRAWYLYLKRDVYVKKQNCTLESAHLKFQTSKNLSFRLLFQLGDKINDKYRFDGNLIANMEEERIAMLKAVLFLSTIRHKALGIVLFIQLKAFHEGETRVKESAQCM